jgi:Flp pilus assembly pilin Flp
MSKLQRPFVRCIMGTTSVEYAMIALSVALGVVLTVGGLGVNLSAYYGAIAQAFP